MQATVNFEYLYDNLPNMRGVVLEGGSRCFTPSQLVLTKGGSKPISELKKGDLVYSYNFNNGNKELKPVVLTMRNKPDKPIIKITLKNGKTIEGTEDHKIMFKGGWVSLKYLVSLWNDRNMETNT